MTAPSLAILVATFAASAGLAWLLSRPGAPIVLLDHPNERSLHERAVPRTGGLAVLGGLAVGWTALWASGTLAEMGSAVGALVLAGAAVAAISFLDDWRGVSPALRLAVHLGAAALLLLGPGQGFGWSDGATRHGWGPGIAAGAVLLIAWGTNLYNFMDGMDGFASGMSVIGFATLGSAAALNDSTGLARACFVIAAAAAGFLLLNFPPARIFLGDLGSSMLGFLAGTLSLWGITAGVFPWWLPLMAFSAFVVDATVTVTRRLSAAERVWMPHRKHFYQRLVRLGWGHRRTVLVEYALMLFTSASALLVLVAGGRGWSVLLGGWSLAFAALGWGVGALEKLSSERAAGLEAGGRL